MYTLFCILPQKINKNITFVFVKVSLSLPYGNPLLWVLKKKVHRNKYIEILYYTSLIFFHFRI